MYLDCYSRHLTLNHLEALIRHLFKQVKTNEKHALNMNILPKPIAPSSESVSESPTCIVCDRLYLTDSNGKSRQPTAAALWQIKMILMKRAIFAVYKEIGHTAKRRQLRFRCIRLRKQGPNSHTRYHKQSFSEEQQIYA